MPDPRESDARRNVRPVRPDDIAVPDADIVKAPEQSNLPQTIGDRIRGSQIRKIEHEHNVEQMRMTYAKLREAHAERLRAGLAVANTKTLAEEQKALAVFRGVMVDIINTSDKVNRDKRIAAHEKLLDDHWEALQRAKDKPWTQDMVDRFVNRLILELDEGTKSIDRSMGLGDLKK